MSPTGWRPSGSYSGGMDPARPLRDVFADLVSDETARAAHAADPDGYLEAQGHPGLPGSLVSEAIVSYADTAPAEVAEHLAPFVLANGPVPVDPLLVDPLVDGDALPGEMGATEGLGLLATAPAETDLAEPAVDPDAVAEADAHADTHIHAGTAAGADTDTDDLADPFGLDFGLDFGHGDAVHTGHYADVPSAELAPAAELPADVPPDEGGDTVDAGGMVDWSAGADLDGLAGPDGTDDADRVDHAGHTPAAGEAVGDPDGDGAEL